MSQMNCRRAKLSWAHPRRAVDRVDPVDEQRHHQQEQQPVRAEKFSSRECIKAANYYANCGTAASRVLVYSCWGVAVNLRGGSGFHDLAVMHHRMWSLMCSTTARSCAMKR